MKTITTILGLVLISSTVFAGVKKSTVREATLKERTYLCVGIDAKLEAEQADAAVDLGECITKSKFKVIQPHESATIIAGKVKLNSPSKYRPVITCDFAYTGAIFDQENVIQGVECGFDNFTK